MLAASSSSWEGEGHGGRVAANPSTCLFSPCIVSWNRLLLRVGHRNGGLFRGWLSAPHRIVVRIGSWSARGGRSVATSEDIPRLSRGLLAQDRSIMFCPRVGESGGSVRVRSWDSAQARKVSALGDGRAEDCHIGCWRLKSPAIRQGRDGVDCAMRDSTP